MSKLKRSALKSVVKECLLELLSEGLNSNMILKTEEKIQPYGNEARQHEVKDLQSKSNVSPMKEAINGITSDPILAGVLGDTAQTTLVEQAEADRKGQIHQMRSSGHASGTVDNEPDGDSHWAALAFSENKSNIK